MASEEEEEGGESGEKEGEREKIFENLSAVEDKVKLML